MPTAVEVGSVQWTAKLQDSQFNKQMKGMSQKMKSVGKSMTDMGKDLTMKVTAPVIGLGTAAFKMSSDFETSFAKIEGLVGVAGEELEQLRQAALELGPEFGKSANEAADAMFFITSAGLRGNDAISVLRESLKASAAGLGEVATIADLSTSAMNAYGSEVLDATEATDVLTNAVRQGKLEPAELSTAMGSVLPVASAMGVTFDEVGASFAAMSRTGTNAAEASTQLSGILSTLLKPSSQAEEALSGMGLSASGLRQQIKDEGLLATLQTLKTNFEGNDEAAAAVFGNIRALRGVLDMMGPSAETTADIFGELSDSSGTLNESFKAVEETSGFMASQAFEDVKAALMELGDELAPVIKDLSEFISSLTDSFKEMSPETKKNIVIIAGLAATIGPLLIGLGMIISSVGTIMGLFSGAITVIGTLISIFSTIGSVVGTVIAVINPITLVIGAIIAVIALLVIAWQKNWFDIQGKAQVAIEFIKGLFNGFMEMLKGVGSFIADIFKTIAAPFIWWWEHVTKPILMLVVAIWLRVWYEIFNFLKNIGEAIFSWLKDNIFDPIGNFIKEAMEAIKGVIVDVWNAISGATQRLWGAIYSKIEGPLNRAKDFVQDTLSSLKDWISNLWNGIVDFFGNIGSKIVDKITGPFKDAKERIENISENIKNAANKINPFERQSPSLVDNVKRGLGVIKREFEGLNDIHIPAVGDIAGGDGTANGQNININVDNVNEMSDLDMIGREIGFRSRIQ